jgi:signal transduction histidine kinase
MGTSGEKGTGLGLIICNDFIKLMGGTIVVESEINIGSKFTISLPIV